MHWLRAGDRILIIGNQVGRSLMESLLVSATKEGVEVTTTGPENYYLQPMPVLEQEVKSSTKIKVGKGPRDKWGKLK